MSVNIGLGDKDKIEFLDPNNDCGQSLLKLVAAGSSNIAELQRLSNYIPDVFLHEPTGIHEENRLAQELQQNAQQPASKASLKPDPNAKKGVAIDKAAAKAAQATN